MKAAEGVLHTGLSNLAIGTILHTLGSKGFERRNKATMLKLEETLKIAKDNSLTIPAELQAKVTDALAARA
jgi:hypothetical protein